MQTDTSPGVEPRFANLSRPDAPPPQAPEPFGFTGRGGEYFGIWITNLLLTIVTFGIYSAWAKVRRLRYFYQHTRLAGAGFDYHGDPVAILKGRLIGLGLVLAYNFSGQISWKLFALTLLLLLVVVFGVTSVTGAAVLALGGGGYNRQNLARAWTRVVEALVETNASP